MNNYLNDFIKDLSIKDKKTLSQKGLKLSEEVGELARVILPYDSAHGTNHRFIDRDAILEEVVDVYLTNISIAHSLGFTDEELNDMLIRKTEKWSKLQVGEESAQFPLPFEIHVTVDASEMRDPIMFDTKTFDLELFKEACLEIGVKPIVIDFETKESESFLNIDKVKDPFNYKIHILEDYQQKEVVVDLIETYNYLISLEVESAGVATSYISQWNVN